MNEHTLLFCESITINHFSKCVESSSTHFTSEWNINRFANCKIVECFFFGYKFVELKMINITESDRIEVAKCEQFITSSYLIAWNSAIIPVDLKSKFRYIFFFFHPVAWIHYFISNHSWSANPKWYSFLPFIIIGINSDKCEYAKCKSKIIDWNFGQRLFFPIFCLIR